MQAMQEIVSELQGELQALQGDQDLSLAQARAGVCVFICVRECVFICVRESVHTISICVGRGWLNSNELM